MNDLDEVGDGIHFSSFQMLGNFSFGNNDSHDNVKLWQNIINELNLPNIEIHIHPHEMITNLSGMAILLLMILNVFGVMASLVASAQKFILTTLKLAILSILLSTLLMQALVLNVFYYLWDVIFGKFFSQKVNLVLFKIIFALFSYSLRMALNLAPAGVMSSYFRDRACS